MKNFKLSMLAMLSGIAMTFTSCLGDGDNTQYISGTGTASLSSITLDNGLTLKTSALELESGKRVYIYASVPGEEYEAAIAKLQNNERASVNLQNIYQAGQCVDGEYNADYYDDLATITTTEMESLSWLTFGAFGNGYMNFSVKADWYTKKVDKTTTTIEPICYLLLKNYDSATKKLELVFTFNNRKLECVEDLESNTLKDGYAVVTGYEIPVSVDMTELYQFLKYDQGLSDDTAIDLSIKFVKNESHEISDTELTGTFYGTNYCTVGMFKNIY